jgi:ribosome maturation factor RimP
MAPTALLKKAAFCYDAGLEKRHSNRKKWAARPIFFSVYGWDCNLRLGELLESTIPPMGFELVDWEMQPRSKLVRVFIDKPKGVDVEDCARVSNHLTHLFTVENIDYDRLEVSSPGLDRPLKKLADYTRFVGDEVALTLHEMTDGARRWKGVLRGVESDRIVLETATGTRTFSLAAIDKARLVPKIEWRKSK